MKRIISKKINFEVLTCKINNLIILELFVENNFGIYFL